MTLPDDDVMALIENRFVLALKNIEKDSHVGMSHGYRKTHSAVGTTNGAGGRNVQFIIMAGDGTVLHALPGFWHPQDLIPELQLALEIHRLHKDEKMPQSRKLHMFAALHKSHMRHHGAASESRGQWQSFDRHAEVRRVQTEERDTFKPAANGTLELKSITEIVHDRLLARPFKQLADFGLESFVDYGRAYYDNNRGHDKGKTFRKAERANNERKLAKQKVDREVAADAELQARKQAREAKKLARRTKTNRKTFKPKQAQAAGGQDN